MRTAAAKGNQEEDEYDDEEFNSSRKEGPSSNSNNSNSKGKNFISAHLVFFYHGLFSICRSNGNFWAVKIVILLIWLKFR